MMWYNEIEDYTFTPTPAYNPKCGHFTQVVWKDSKEIGAGRAKSKNGTVYIVCRYSPAGNNMNKFADNINAPGTQDVNMNKENIPDVEEIVPMIEAGVYSSPDKNDLEPSPSQMSSPSEESMQINSGKNSFSASQKVVVK